MRGAGGKKEKRANCNYSFNISHISFLRSIFTSKVYIPLPSMSIGVLGIAVKL
jgi:hypothetical protein